MKITRFLFSPVFMGILFFVFAAAMAIATFIGNDFGSSASFSLVYNTRWFELILVLIAANLISQLIIFKLFRKEKLPVALFHLSFILMIIGAGITRYSGWEGTIHIREGETKNICFSDEKYINYSVINEAGEIIAEESGLFNTASLSSQKYSRKINAGTREYNLSLSHIIPNAVEAVTDDPYGQPVSVDPDQQETGQNAFVFNLTSGKDQETIYLWDRQSENISTASCMMGGLEFKISYGSKITELPFSLKLNDFILEHYPGSASPSGYKSDVTVINKAGNTEKPFLIFMNNILKYRGFRFYQSSYDQDEKGTILSVNHDMAGMIVTYTGYALLFLFIILSLLIRTSSFRNIKSTSWNSPLRKGVTAVIFLLIVSGFTSSYGQKFVPGRESSEEFGKVLIQDQKGRTKPLFALSNDILRKVTRENKFKGYTLMQVFLGSFLILITGRTFR